MNKTTEQEILSMLKEPGSRDMGFKLLMDTYKERIYWYIRRLVVTHEDAEDILQETFINAFNYAVSFRGNSLLYTWLYRIATNECIRHFRHEKRKGIKKVEVSKKLAEELKDFDMESGDALLLKFQEAILRLPRKQQLVFNMRYYDELSYEEISQVLNSSVGALKTNYHYATEKIKEILKNQ